MAAHYQRQLHEAGFQAVQIVDTSKQEGLPESQWCYWPVCDPKAMPALAASTIASSASIFP
jgi:hypothetical protein